MLANRRDFDRFAGVDDPVELLQLIHTPPKPDGLVRLMPPPRTAEQLYLLLTQDQAQRLMRFAVERLASDEQTARSIATCLAAFTPYPFDDLLEAWLDRSEPYPSIIFRRANDHVRERLCELLADSASQSLANHTLSALAWVGDDAVARFLCQADIAGPEWSRTLYIGPADYARVAGWELRGSERRNLTFDSCIVLKTDAKEDERTHAVKVMQPQETEACRWCGGGLTNLLELDLADPLFEAFRQLGRHVAVLTCRLCTCYGTFFADLDESGRGHWCEANKRPDYLPDGAELEENPWASAAIRLQPRPPLQGADWCLPTTLSQIGGVPGWVQDVDYPACPKCSRTMMFLAQIDQAAFPDAEGVYYAFICNACRITATCYQQT